MHHPTDRITHTTAFVTPVVEHWLEREIAQWVHRYRTSQVVIEETIAATSWATLSDQQQGFFYMHHPTGRIAHTTAFVILTVEHWLEREIAQWVHHKGSILQPIAP